MFFAVSYVQPRFNSLREKQTSAAGLHSAFSLARVEVAVLQVPWSTVENERTPFSPGLGCSPLRSHVVLSWPDSKL